MSDGKVELTEQQVDALVKNANRKVVDTTSRQFVNILVDYITALRACYPSADKHLANADAYIASTCSVVGPNAIVDVFYKHAAPHASVIDQRNNAGLIKLMDGVELLRDIGVSKLFSDSTVDTKAANWDYVAKLWQLALDYRKGLEGTFVTAEAIRASAASTGRRLDAFQEKYNRLPKTLEDVRLFHALEVDGVSIDGSHVKTELESVSE